MTSSASVTPTPSDAPDMPPDVVGAELDMAPPEKQPQPPHPVERSERKRSHGQDGSKHKVGPPTPPTDSFDPFGSPE